MFKEIPLIDILNRKGLTVSDRFLVCLAAAGKPLQIKEIRKAAIDSGFRPARNLNVSAHLRRSGGKAVRTAAGWELTIVGKNHIGNLMNDRPEVRGAKEFKKTLTKIKDEKTRRFVEEAVNCAECSLFRAAVVLSWVGAMSVLYDFVISKYLSAFNAEASRRDAKWRNADTADGLARMKEYDFLNCLEAISVIGKNVKQELEVCLKLRNGCGHPSTLQIGHHKVAAHIETLILNVFTVFL